MVKRILSRSLSVLKKYWQKLLWKLFDKEFDQYVAWAKYEIGFDLKPKFKKPWLPKFIKDDCDEMGEEWRKHWQNWFLKLFCQKKNNQDIINDAIKIEMFKVMLQHNLSPSKFHPCIFDWSINNVISSQVILIDISLFYQGQTYELQMNVNLMNYTAEYIQNIFKLVLHDIYNYKKVLRNGSR